MVRPYSVWRRQLPLGYSNEMAKSTEDSHPESWHWLTLAGLALVAAAIFFADLNIRGGYTFWVLYLPLYAEVARSNKPRTALIASAVAMILIVAGYYFAAGGPEPFRIINRALEAVTIWLAVGFTIFRRRVELASLRAAQANAHLAGILNSADDAIISVDSAYRIRIFNNGAERAFGYAAAEIIGQSLDVLLPIESARRHQTHMESFKDSHVQSRRMSERGPVLARRRDGTLFRAEVSISKHGARDEPIFTAILRDITQRVAAEELSRSRARRLRLALVAGQMGTFDLDERTGAFQSDEAMADLLGIDLPSGGATEADVFARICADDRVRVRERLNHVRVHGGEYFVEFRVMHSYGEQRWIAAQGFCELDANGTALRTTGVAYDVTERKHNEQALEARVADRTAALEREIERREQAQAALLRSQKLQAVGELAGGIAHDFNNLLTVITGNLELLGLGQLGEKARDLLRRSDEAAKMAARLARRLLAIGQRQALQPVSLNLSEVARSMTDVLRRTLGDTITIKSEFADSLWSALADISEVENAILNLAINARDAMPQGGTLRIRTENFSLSAGARTPSPGLQSGDYVVLTIADTGTGMMPDVLARAFEPYFTTKAPGRGTGLGLSTIYGFAEQSGGHLAIQSAPERGTSVSLYLPRAKTDNMATAARGVKPIEASAVEETILIVEDNADVRDITVKRVDMLGYQTLKAGSGAAAIEILKAESKIDLLFSDIVLPDGVSGIDLVQWVRENRPAVKVLLTSGYAGESATSNGALPRGVEILRKPYELADLARALRGALNSI